MNIFIVGGSLLVFLVYLGWESFKLKRKRRLIPLRICVTGTRGKSTVVRMLAASLQQAGFQVVAKTTGSKPEIILADGTEKEIARRGLPSLLEGRKLIELAVRERAQILVAEMMSICPESMATESIRIFAPHIMVITNVRSDHREQWGDSKAGIAGCFAAAVPSGSNLFIPEEEMYPVFRNITASRAIKLNPVPEEILSDSRPGSDCEFAQNIRLAVAVSRHLEVAEDTIVSGLQKVNPDFGSLQVWRTNSEGGSRNWYFVSGFAANDPESTCQVLGNLQLLLPLAGKKLIGLLNLRWDRADRTRQWLDAIACNSVPEFDILALVGGHARAAARWLARHQLQKQVIVLKNVSAENILQSLRPYAPDEAVVLGMGNMGGAGEKLVSLFREIGESYVL